MEPFVHDIDTDDPIALRAQKLAVIRKRRKNTHYL